MSLTPSKIIPLRSAAPSFTLPDTISGRDLRLEDIMGKKATVVMFICNHCPYVKHLNAGITKISSEYISRGVGFVGISANDISDYPQDGPQYMKQTAQQEGYNFPYLYDETQEVAKTYGATCTPDFFIFDAAMKLAYHGQFDSSRPENDEPVTGESFRVVLDTLIKGEVVSIKQFPSIGCSIKWKQ